MMHKRKVNIKHIQDDLKSEQLQYKREYEPIKNEYAKSGNPVPIAIKTKFDVTKSNLNRKIKEYNDKLAMLREEEDSYRKKLVCLEKIE
jgi:hypothetical protein